MHHLNPQQTLIVPQPEIMECERRNQGELDFLIDSLATRLFAMQDANDFQLARESINQKLGGLSGLDRDLRGCLLNIVAMCEQAGEAYTDSDEFTQQGAAI